MTIKARVKPPQSDTGNLIRDSALGLVPDIVAKQPEDWKAGATRFRSEIRRLKRP